MLNALRYSNQLRQLQASKRRIRKTYKKVYEEAKRNKISGDELAAIDFEEYSEVAMVNDDIWFLQARYLSRKAARYLLPKPPFNEVEGNWIQSQYSGKWRLSNKALAKLRTEIHNERKHRREYWTSWITAVTGLIGALIGLVAITK